MNLPRRVCIPCRLKLLARAYHGQTVPSSSHAFLKAYRSTSNRNTSNAANNPRVRNGKDLRRFASTEAPSSQEDDGFVIKRGSHVISGQEPADEDVGTPQEIDASTIQYTPEGIAFVARQRFGDRLPIGLLNEEEYTIYERNYGPPTGWDDISALAEGEDGENTLEATKEVLLRELADGTLSEVFNEDDMEEVAEEMLDELDEFHEEDSEESLSLDQHMQSALSATVYEREPQSLVYSDPDAPVLRFGEQMEEPDGEELRAHPFTLQNRSGTMPSTLLMPKEMTVPVTKITSGMPNKHLDEASQNLLGGPGLPYGTGTPIISRTMPQKPIPQSAGQPKMSRIEADVFCIALMPGIYAAVTNVLVEVRKRLGSAWIQDLMQKEGGPRVLDVGGGGAGAIAWREILKAEWARMHGDLPANPVPEGKATVVVGNPALMQRASQMLENTSFIPRLPDYVHAFSDPGAAKKQYDVIIAPHTLWQMENDEARGLQIEKLWSLLEPSRGILVLIEKGVPRGFETIADARSYLLKKYLEPNTEVVQSIIHEKFGGLEEDVPNINTNRKSSGAIVAPCTNRGGCPMYPVPGISQRRKDYCHFVQRYTRPSYYQRMLGAKVRNHEDVRFSYIAVQKGVKAENLKPQNSARDSMLGRTVQERTMGQYATERAAEGFSLDDPDVTRPLQHLERAGDDSSPTTPPHAAPNPFSLPRTLYPPLKRKGHVIFDVCTPSSTLERWTVARSYGKQAYRDARKLQWGDLWALGASTRVVKNVRLGGFNRNATRREAAQEAMEEAIEVESQNGNGQPVPREYLKAMKGGRGRAKQKDKQRKDLQQSRSSTLQEE